MDAKFVMDQPLIKFAGMVIGKTKVAVVVPAANMLLVVLFRVPRIER